LTGTAGLLVAEQSVSDVSRRFATLGRTAVARARASHRPVLVWTTVSVHPVDPLEVVRFAATHSIEPMLWARPADGFSLIGLGRAWECAAAGDGRFEAARVAWDDLRRSALAESEAAGAPNTGGAWGAGPVLLGGFSFSPPGPVGPEWTGFGAASLVLPQLALAVHGDAGWLTLCLVARPEMSDDDVDAAARRADAWLSALSQRARTFEVPRASDVRSPAVGHQTEIITASDWKNLVGAAARAVRDGELKKVVVARALKVVGAVGSPVEALSRLRAGYPTCAVFAVVRGGRWFLGATPERLVRVRRGEVSAMALAGSAPRGKSLEDDRRFAEALLASAKDRVEHAIVVEMVRRSLSGACDAISVAEAPALLKVSNVQHLHTPIAARLREGSTIFDLIERLHPTPAVGGVPRAPALDWLRCHEGLDRGWYAGPVGWIDRRGEGEFSVAIRSALLLRDEAVLYAGCGIVAESDPDAEYAESLLKLRAMLAALGANGEAHSAESRHDA
jgi:isochorismate synthase